MSDDQGKDDEEVRQNELFALARAAHDCPPLHQVLIKGAGKAARAWKKNHTPLPGNLCHDDDGEVVKKVISLFRGKYGYSLPACATCGRQYLSATNVKTVGLEEFEKLLHQSFTT